MNRHYPKFEFLIVIFLVTALLPTSTIFAKNPGISDEEKTSQPVMIEKIVKIIDKGKDFIEIRHVGRLKIQRDTVIYSPSKTRISLIFLDIPSWAKIRYQEGDGEPVLKEIQVLKPQPE
ncbi:MAG: hypothetical protein JRJ73_05440 [Deltaproteobacteria bacterium]|nr:hypothetical protein [Deltaproteobacteria bacterium]MBW2052229.1 hypothetical protein [Deltaproteobacteria bacterium]